MSILRRIQLDLSPAFGMLLALFAVGTWCDVVSDGDTLRSVSGAGRLAYWIAGFWWIVSDSIRRGYRLMPAWGTYLLLFNEIAVVAYLFRTRGWWAFVTLALYSLLIFAVMVIAALLA